MEFGNSNQHKMQYLFPRQLKASTPSPITAFPSIDLTHLTDSICIDLFAQWALEPQETSSVATIGSAADETHE